MDNVRRKPVPSLTLASLDTVLPWETMYERSQVPDEDTQHHRVPAANDCQIPNCSCRSRVLVGDPYNHHRNRDAIASIYTETYHAPYPSYQAPTGIASSSPMSYSRRETLPPTYYHEDPETPGGMGFGPVVSQVSSEEEPRSLLSDNPAPAGSTVPPAAPPAASPSTPPNGGVTAWLQVAGAFLLFFSSWGLVNTFGVFQEYYQQTLLSNLQPSSISWIGTVQGFLLIVVGVLSGPLYDLGYLRALIGTGAGFIFMGLLIAGEVREFFGIFLSLALLVGLGAGCLFVPSVAIVAQYFTSKRPFATGIAAAGGSFGGVIFPIVFRQALEHVGYGWACRILAFMALASLVWPFLVMKPRTIPAAKRRLLDLTAFRDLSFSLFSISLFFTFIGLYIPFFYVPTYARTKLGVNDALSFYLLSVLNTGSFFGRIIPNLVANYAGSFNVLLFCVFTSGILLFFWIPVESLAALVAFGVLYGFFSGAVVSLPPTALLTISPDISKVGTRLGMSFSFAGFGLLVGSPIAGALLRSRFSFVGVQVFAGVVVVIGLVLLIGAFLVFSDTKKKASGDAEK